MIEAYLVMLSIGAVCAIALAFRNHRRETDTVAQIREKADRIVEISDAISRLDHRARRMVQRTNPATAYVSYSYRQLNISRHAAFKAAGYYFMLEGMANIRTKRYLTNSFYGLEGSVMRSKMEFPFESTLPIADDEVRPKLIISNAMYGRLAKAAS